MTRCLNMKALREALSVSRTTIYEWMARKDDRTRLHRIGGTSRVLVSEAELYRWQEANRT